MKKNSITKRLKEMDESFKTVETFKADFSKCGENMDEPKQLFNLDCFYKSDYCYYCQYGIKNETIPTTADKNSKQLQISNPEYFSPGITVLIYNSDQLIYEYNQVKTIAGNTLVLKYKLQHDYPQDSNIIVIREIKYKYNFILETLKRRVDRGKFQLLNHNVTRFYIFFLNFKSLKIFCINLEINERVTTEGEVSLT
jgi:hypothetical protein